VEVQTIDRDPKKLGESKKMIDDFISSQNDD